MVWCLSYMYKIVRWCNEIWTRCDVGLVLTRREMVRPMYTLSQYISSLNWSVVTCWFRHGMGVVFIACTRAHVNNNTYFRSGKRIETLNFQPPIKKLNCLPFHLCRAFYRCIWTFCLVQCISHCTGSHLLFYGISSVPTFSFPYFSLNIPIFKDLSVSIMCSRTDFVIIINVIIIIIIIPHGVKLGFCWSRNGHIAFRNTWCTAITCAL